jgi:threonine dehydratase
MQDTAVVAVTSGANMNFDRLRLVSDLCNYGLRTEAMLSCKIPELPGTFRTFIDTLYGDFTIDAHLASDAEADGAADDKSQAVRSPVDITEFKYRYSVDQDATILLSIATPEPEGVEAAVSRLNTGGRFVCKDITSNHLAQVHLRHMVGGRPRSYSGKIEDERMVVVSFPERSGALRLFLREMAAADSESESTVNVTMFHYRATGNRSSSVLLGLQLPASKHAAYGRLQTALQAYDFTFDDLDADTQDLFDQFVS